MFSPAEVEAEVEVPVAGVEALEEALVVFLASAADFREYTHGCCLGCAARRSLHDICCPGDPSYRILPEGKPELFASTASRRRRRAGKSRSWHDRATGYFESSSSFQGRY
jgi:hypothetical protein